MKRRWIAVGALLALPTTNAGAAWTHARHDIDATNRAQGTGALDGSLGHEPGFLRLVDVRQRQLAAGQLWDTDGDGVPEYLTAQHGSAVALDLRTGELRWRSPPRGLDQLVAIDDLDGDGQPELLAAASGVGGGLHVVDLATGALLGGWTELPERSGVDANELTRGDLDGDGVDEWVVPAGLFGLAQAWVLDFGTGLPTPAVQELSFEGYANVTPARLVRAMPGGGAAMVIDQGTDQRVYVPCEAGLCEAMTFGQVHPTYAFGRTHVLDLDGDGFDEILTVASTPNASRSISVLDVAEGLATGRTSSLVEWAWRYEAAVPVTQLRTPSQPPVDLDGDGRIEVVVSVVNDLGTEVDASGSPANDGVNRPGAISTLVLDGPTGAVELVLDDVFAYGWADLDLDGLPELVVSPTDGWTHQEGLAGLQLSCDGTCVEPRWQRNDVRVHRYLQELDGTGLPEASLWATQAPGGLPGLVVHRGDDQLGLLRVNAGEVVLAETFAVSATAQVHGSSDDWVVVADDDTMQLLGPTLVPLGEAVPKPRRGSASWRAAPERAGGATALAFEGRVLASDLPLLPHVAMLDDLGGDDRLEVVHFRNPDDGLGPGFEVRLDRLDGGQLQPIWARQSHGDPLLDGYVTASALHFSMGDFDGQGARDVVFPARRGSQWSYLVLDGDTGSLDAILEPGGAPSSFSPALVADLLVGSGFDELLMHGSSVLALLSVGSDGPVQTVAPGFYQSVGLNADLDGDGQREVLGTLSATLDNQMEARRPTGAMDLVWGPQELGRPSGYSNVLAVGQLDDLPGLDPVYIDGDAGLAAYSGADGSLLPGFPVYLADGGVHGAPPDGAAVTSAVIVADVDGDGFDEAVVGAVDGRIYAVDIAASDPSRGQLRWSLEVGAAVVELAAADADDDGALEVLVANARGEGLVIDDLGVVMDIDPVQGCVGPGPHRVEGHARGLAQVELWLNGSSAAAPTPVVDERWTHTIELPGPGEYQLEARGLDEGGQLRLLATDTLEVQETCPDQAEPPLPPQDDDCGSDCDLPTDEPYDDGLIDRGCLCGTGPRAPGAALWVGLALLGLRRRRRG